MAELYHVDDTPPLVCWDRKYYNTFEDQVKALKNSRTVYVGNLSFFTTEMQLHEAFSVVAPIKRIVMGLYQFTKTPCGFCFVEYYSHEHAAAALVCVSGTVCDGRIIRCDMDAGFKPGRQFGRGMSGGQIRDERRKTHDPARGEFPQPPLPFSPSLPSSFSLSFCPSFSIYLSLASPIFLLILPDSCCTLFEQLQAVR